MTKKVKGQRCDDGQIQLFHDVDAVHKTEIDGYIDKYVAEHDIGNVTREEVEEIVQEELAGSGVEDAVETWLNNHPEATTTVQDGSVSNKKLGNDVLEHTSAVKWISQRIMRDGKHSFQGWAHCIRYDKELGKAIGIVMGANTTHGTSLPLYRVTIDDDGYMSDYEEIKFYDTDGETEYALSEGYLSCLCQLSNGSYITQCQNDITGLFKSTDKCKTFTRFAISGLASACQLFGMVQLSTGRLLAKCNGRSRNNSTIAYSDDLGITWTETAPFDLSVLGNPPFEGDSSYSFDEVNFIEFSDGKILGIGRASVNAKSSSGTLRGHKEGAVISYSNDYGTTWGGVSWSRTLTDMTSCNASNCYANGVYHVALSSRYAYTQDSNGVQRYSAMYYHWATEKDALNDNWSKAEVIDYGHRGSSTDTGYPSLWVDKHNNLHAVWYDGDGSNDADKANWNLAIANIANNYNLRNDGGGSYVVGYTQKQVEKLLFDQKRAMMSFISDLYEKIGQLPPDSGDDDGSMYITDGLQYYFIPADSTTWGGADGAANKYYINAKYSANGAAYLRANSSGSNLSMYDGKWSLAALNILLRVAPSANVSASTYAGKTLSELSVASADGFTIEGSGYVRAWQHTNLITMGSIRWWSYSDVPVVVDGALSRVSIQSEHLEVGYHHIAVTVSPAGASVYLDGNLLGGREYAEGDYDIVKAAVVTHHMDNYMCLSTLRYYNKPLTASEVKNNYLYDSSMIAEKDAEVTS